MRISFWIATLTTFGLCCGTIILNSGSKRMPTCWADPRVLPDDAVDLSIDYSNILPVDYVGPQLCADCHTEQYNDWRDHPHALMNQLPSEQSVKGDFGNAVLELPTGRVEFKTTRSSKKGSQLQYHMVIYKLGQEDSFREYCVTKTVGTRYIQAYIGRQTQGPEPQGDAIYDEHMLPFSYWFKIKQWLPSKYYNIFHDESLQDGIPQTEAIDESPTVLPYREVCMNCHNTFPYAYRIYHQSLVGFPDATVASAIGPLANQLSNELRHIDGSVRSMNRLNEILDPDQDLVTMGISCESCHLGGREHAEHEREIKFLPTSKFTRVIAKTENIVFEGRGYAPTLLGTCAQCHSGEGELFPTGGGKSNSREALDFHKGFCTSEMSCVNCHDPHTASAGPSGGPELATHANTCKMCHSQFATDQSALSHSGYAGHAELSCLDCHMPRYTRGVDELIRTHRICNPVEKEMIAQGMANACNSCHLEKSMQWTLDELAKTWHHRITPQVEWRSWNDLKLPAGEVWLDSKDSHMRLVASQLYGRYNGGEKLSNEKVRRLIHTLNDPERINRVFGSFTVKRLLGWPMDEKLPVDITAAPSDRQRQIENWLRELRL